MTTSNTQNLQDTMVRLGEKLLASVCCGSIEMGADVLGGYVWARFPSHEEAKWAASQVREHLELPCKTNALCHLQIKLV